MQDRGSYCLVAGVRDKNKSEFRANARCGWRICACPHTAARRQAKGAIARRRRVWSSINSFTPARLKPLLPLQFRSTTLANKVIRPHSLHEYPSIENLMHQLYSQNHFLQSHVQILDILPTFFGKSSPRDFSTVTNLHNNHFMLVLFTGHENLTGLKL
jgi:hypothetical protein